MKIPPSLPTTIATGLTILSSTHAQFYGRTSPGGGFFNGNHARRDIATEKQDIRLADEVFLNAARIDIEKLGIELERSEYATMKERGSAYLEDGVSPIVENASFGASVDDPRVPVGFGEPLVKRNLDVIVGDTASSVLKDAVDIVHIATFESGWILIDSIGRLYDNDMPLPEEFNSLLSANPVKLVRIVCESCASSHREVFYRRDTTAPTNLLDIIRKDWTSASNTFNVDFSLYSTYEDAVSGQNAWQYCGGFNTEGQGFPGTCGPVGASEDQWINMELRNGQPDVAIFVQDAAAPAEVFYWGDWELGLEEFHIGSPTEAAEKGLCWHLPLSDSRRKCWLACRHSERTNDLGVLKLCLNMRYKGQVWKTKDFGEESEDFEGTGVDHKIKATHALGFDDDLPNLGTY